jgi:hypothetical protein
MPQSQQTPIDLKEFAKTLEPLIRRVVREELTRIVRKEPYIFYLDPEMPLYKDMEEIRQRKEQDQIELHSHEEAWGE